MDKKEVQPTTEKSEQELMQDFFKEYQRLCDKRGFQIAVSPASGASGHSFTLWGIKSRD